MAARQRKMKKDRRAQQPKSPDPYATPTEEETMALAAPEAKSIVHTLMVRKHLVPECDADWYENGCLIAAANCRKRYDARRIAERTGKPCPFISFVKHVMRGYVAEVSHEICVRAGRMPLVSLDADPATLDMIEARAIQELRLAGSTKDHERLVARLDLEMAVDALPPALREAARLIFLEGVPRADVPARLGISASSFFHGMSRKINERMKAALPGWEPEDCAPPRKRSRRRRTSR